MLNQITFAALLAASLLIAASADSRNRAENSLEQNARQSADRLIARSGCEALSSRTPHARYQKDSLIAQRITTLCGAIH